MVSSIVIVLAVGLAVDCSTHIVYAFLESPGDDRDARTRDALMHIGSTVVRRAHSLTHSLAHPLGGAGGPAGADRAPPARS